MLSYAQILKNKKISPVCFDSFIDNDNLIANFNGLLGNDIKKLIFWNIKLEYKKGRIITQPSNCLISFFHLPFFLRLIFSMLLFP